MSEDTQLVKRQSEGVAIHMRQATDVAGACREIVEATAQMIQGKRYVRVEGWQAIANAHGCMASSRDVERVAGGFRCIGEVRRIDTGAVVSTAEGFVGDDEKTWADRPEYAKRAMCQTRAISRACRSAFAHVVVMMKAGLETTPAEEVPAEGFEHAKQVTPEEKTASTAPHKSGVARVADQTSSEFANGEAAKTNSAKVEEILAWAREIWAAGMESDIDKYVSWTDGRGEKVTAVSVDEVLKAWSYFVGRKDNKEHFTCGEGELRKLASNAKAEKVFEIMYKRARDAYNAWKKSLEEMPQ